MSHEKELSQEQLIKLIRADIPEETWPKWARYAHVLGGAHKFFLFIDLCQANPVSLVGSHKSQRKRIPVSLKDPVLLGHDFTLAKKRIFTLEQEKMELKPTSDPRLAGEPGYIFQPAAETAPAVDRGEKYRRQIKGVTVDIYDFLDAFGVTCSASQHAIKKLMMPGARGAKDRLKDLREADVSVLRAIELEEERQKSVT